MTASILAWCILAAGAGLAQAAPPPPASPIGKRPYELDWANRAEDHCPPLVDFEDLRGWRVECKDAEAKFEPTREQQIWGEYVGKLTYRATGSAPEVRILPPNPIPIVGPFDAVTLWCYGNNWGWATDPSTPHAGVTALFLDAAGEEFSVFLYRVDWKEWFLLHRRLTPEQIQRVKQGARFKGLLITNGKNQEDRVLYFDNLAVFTEQFQPLTFEPRPLRGCTLLPGQSAGANTGPGRLPFPTREQTILPGNLTEQFTNSIKAPTPGTAEAFALVYEGVDGRLTCHLKPETGTWSDLAFDWEFPLRSGAGPQDQAVCHVQPCVDGGVYLENLGRPSAA